MWFSLALPWYWWCWNTFSCNYWISDYSFCFVLFSDNACLILVSGQFCSHNVSWKVFLPLKKSHCWFFKCLVEFTCTHIRSETCLLWEFLIESISVLIIHLLRLCTYLSLLLFLRINEFRFLNFFVNDHPQIVLLGIGWITYAVFLTLLTSFFRSDNTVKHC